MKIVSRRKRSRQHRAEALPPYGRLALADVMRIIHHSPEEEGLLLLLHLLVERGEWRIARAMQEYAMNCFPRSPWGQRLRSQELVEFSTRGQSAA